MTKSIRGNLLLLTSVLLLILTISLLFQRDATAQPRPTDSNSEPMLERRIETFFNKLTSTTGGMKTALEDLFQDSPLLSRGSTDLMETMSQKFTELKDSGIGSFQGYELVDSKWIGKDLVVMRYLYKGENFPVLWSFQFYRTSRGTVVSSSASPWNIINVRFDTNMEPLFAGP